MEIIKGKYIRYYDVSPESGLNDDQIQERLNHNAINKEKHATKINYFQIIFKNVFTFFNILLFCIAAILMYFQLWTNLIFLVILFANLIIGLFQDIRAKIIVDKLTLVQKNKITVIREGRKQEVYSDELFLDDIAILKGNDLVPCDSVVLSGKCSCNESILTGESETVKKEVGSTLLSGSYITSGEVICRIDKIAGDNYINKLQKQSREFKSSRSQLYIQLNQIFKVITIFVIILGAAQITTGIIRLLNSHIEITFELVSMNLIKPLAGAIISLIPSGMYLLASTSLTVGVINLSKNKVLVNDMYSLDTLARVDTLCIDKTGTITDGTMAVKEYIKIDQNYPVLQDFNNIMSSFNAALNDTNFTALALLKRFGDEAYYKKDRVINFDSERKYSAATLKNLGTIAIGAYGFIPFPKDDFIENKINKLSESGERTLVVGYSPNSIDENDNLPNDLVCIAIIVIEDHIKDDAKVILDWFKNNDVDIKVISGDNYLTVQKIATEVKLKNADKGVSLMDKSEEEVKELAKHNTVFGRVSPEQKKFIVESLKEEGHIVAMFGDGVNDILAFKASDVSISVANGAGAAKDLANLILIDNMFSSLPSIVAQGRRVINNLQRTCSLFLVKTAFSIILNIFFLIFSFATGYGWPFSPSSFYAWEFCSIGLSAFLLALEPNNERIKGGFIKNITKRAIPNAVVLALTIMLLYTYFAYTDVFNNNLNIYRSIATYVISIGSMMVLFEVCFPLNKYRSIVFGIAFLMCIALFAWSIYGTNWLDLYPTTAPRYLGSEAILTILIVVIILFVILVLKWFINYLITNKNDNIITRMLKKVKHEKHRTRN